MTLQKRGSAIKRRPKKKVSSKVHPVRRISHWIPGDCRELRPGHHDGKAGARRHRSDHAGRRDPSANHVDLARAAPSPAADAPRWRCAGVAPPPSSTPRARIVRHEAPRLWARVPPPRAPPSPAHPKPGALGASGLGVGGASTRAPAPGRAPSGWREQYSVTPPPTVLLAVMHSRATPSSSWWTAAPDTWIRRVLPTQAPTWQVSVWVQARPGDGRGGGGRACRAPAPAAWHPLGRVVALPWPFPGSRPKRSDSGAAQIPDSGSAGAAQDAGTPVPSESDVVGVYCWSVVRSRWLRWQVAGQAHPGTSASDGRRVRARREGGRASAGLGARRAGG